MTVSKDPKTPGAAENEDRLSRWSRLKQAEREKNTGTPPQADLREKSAALPAVTTEAAPDVEEEINPEDLPDIDAMDRDSDFTIFLKKGVPEMLQRKALRKLWKLDPAFGFLDGMNDYDEDYSMIGIVAMEIKTAYRAGKGFIESDEEKFDLPEEAEAKAKAAGEEQNKAELDDGDDPQATTAEENDAETGGDPELQSAESSAEKETKPHTDRASSVRKPMENDTPIATETVAHAEPGNDDEIGDGEDDT